jgi:excisionase family DNA binding protein
MSQVSSAKASVPPPRQKMERLLSVDEVAEFLGIPVATLYQWRHKGAGPDAYRVGRAPPVRAGRRPRMAR